MCNYVAGIADIFVPNNGSHDYLCRICLAAGHRLVQRKERSVVRCLKNTEMDGREYGPAKMQQ